MNGFQNLMSSQIFRLLAMICRYIIYMREYTVYIHKNLKNEKYYVGCTSQNPKKRWDSGWGYQRNPKMWKDIQNSDWNKDWVHGILGKFKNEQDALKYESFLIAMLGSAENGYNSSTYSSYGFTEETKRKLSELMTGRVFTEEHRKKLSESLTGHEISEETKKKISESHKGKINAPTKSVVQYSKDGEFITEYTSTMEAERQTGCIHQNISKCCKGKLKSAGGYIWRYAS